MSSPPAPGTSGAAPPSPHAPGRRRWLVALLTMLLPVGAPLLLEAGLRLGGYGQSRPLFVPVDGAQDYRRASPDVIRRFLVDPGRAPKLWIRPVPFRVDPEPATIRLVVQGGSSAAGYPYGYGASLAGMLQQRLQRTFPDRPVEVITTAVSGVNSYTLLDFSREILAQEPDAVLIYAGHNEYLGLLGVGSAFSAGRHRPLVRSFLALKDVRLLQLGRSALGALAAPAPAPRDGERRTLMERVVAEERIPYGSELYERGLAQYHDNLRDLLQRYRRAGVPVFVGTVVSNERDQKPFLDAPGPGADVEAWQRHFDAAAEAFTAGAPAAALAELDRAVAIDDLRAAGHFARGRVLESLARHPEAREAYLAARDRDELRFRAPRAINRVVRKVAAEQGAHVVEVEEAFRRASPHGIVGRELMLEHLHPNVEGYFVLADAFYDALHRHSPFGPWEAPVERERAWREIPVTAVDRLYGEHRVARLTAGWPFAESDRHPPPAASDELAWRLARDLHQGRRSWPDAMRRLLDHHRSRGEVAEAVRVAVVLADAFPYRREDQLAAARLLERAGRPEGSLYQRRAGEEDTRVAAGTPTP